jgi:hypothetical protein
VTWLTDFVRGRIAQIRAGHAEPKLRILDDGTGTSFQAIALLKAWESMGILKELAELGVDWKLYLTDLPSVWFAKGVELFRGHPQVSCFAIRDEATQTFLKLRDVLGGERVDAVLASMVFHLIPVTALPGTSSASPTRSCPTAFCCSARRTSGRGGRARCSATIQPGAPRHRPRAARR